MTIDLRELYPEVKELDKKSLNALLRALKESFDSNQFDYFRFKKSVESLTQLDMDKATSYKSAFATASTIGLTKESLLKSASKYLNILDEERESFATALLARQKTHVDGRKDEVAIYAQKIKEHEHKILELQREIEIFKKRIENVGSDVESTAAKLSGTKERFLSVYNVLYQAISDDIATINEYL